MLGPKTAELFAHHILPLKYLILFVFSCKFGTQLDKSVFDALLRTSTEEPSVLLLFMTSLTRNLFRMCPDGSKASTIVWKMTCSKFSLVRCCEWVSLQIIMGRFQYKVPFARPHHPLTHAHTHILTYIHTQNTQIAKFFFKSNFKR